MVIFSIGQIGNSILLNGGDTMPRRIIAPPKEGNVVKEMKIGNTRIKICDDYVVKTQEEREAILQRVAQIAYDIYASKPSADAKEAI